MSKKSFSGGLDSLLGNRPDKTKRGKPVIHMKEITKSIKQGTKEGETRATFIINEKLLESLKAIAYWERVLIKDVLNKAIKEAVIKYKKKNGALNPIPKK